MSTQKHFTTPNTSIVTDPSKIVLLGTDNDQCPIQMKILSNTIRMSHISKQKFHESFESTYQTPTKNPFSPITAKYFSPVTSNPWSSAQHSPVTPKEPPLHTPNTNQEIYATPLNIQDFASPTFSCGDISPIFFDFKKVSSTPPPMPVSMKEDCDKVFDRIPFCQELNGTPNGSFFPLHDKENVFAMNPPKISPDYIKSQSFTPTLCPPASSSRRYRRKCEVPSCPNRVVQGGVCISHGAKRKLCGFSGCTKHVKKAGMCSKHGPPRKRCDLDGCTKVAVQGGRCIAHGARKRICSKDGCNRQVFSYGMCKKHRLDDEE